MTDERGAAAPGEGGTAAAALEQALDALGVLAARDVRSLRRHLGIVTVRDLLEHYPHTDKYRDTGAQVAIAEARIGLPATIVGRIAKWQVVRPRGGRLTIAKAVVADDDGGRVEAPFFNQEWRPRAQPAGTRVAVSGALERFRGTLQLKNAKLVVLDPTDDADTAELDRLQPTYPATEALPSHRIAAAVRAVLEALPSIPDYLPEPLRARRSLAPLDWAVRALHRPEDLADVARARERLVYDELFCLQVGLQQRRYRLEAQAEGLQQQAPAGGAADRLLTALAFDPTPDQTAACAEIDADMGRPKPMHRLLQGDVGTGKTLVAVRAMLAAHDHGRQAVLMVPTAVLAEQHARTITELLAPLGVNAPAGPRLELLTGGTGAAQVRRILGDLADGSVSLLIGTHAVLEDRVRFADLGLVVIDEQHRFGVEHRTRLRDKRADGRTPDILVMTATPIPRSLALTVYGDLDVTSLRHRPGGDAVTVRTEVLASDSPRRAGLYAFIRDEVAHGRRAFVVCPLVEGSDALDEVADAEAMHAQLSRRVFPDIEVALVHGRIPAAERDARMEAFRSGRAPILVATTVIEVGVDVPDASVMVIEDADRFGISQLHQLRGRLYRGHATNYCVLFSRQPDANPRLDAVAATTDGFRLAEVDLELRGEGSLFDTRQSGLPDLRLAVLGRDLDTVVATRGDARALIADDPQLAAHPVLRAEVRRRYGPRQLEALETG